MGVRIRVYTRTPSLHSDATHLVLCARAAPPIQVVSNPSPPSLVHDIYAYTVYCGECSWPRPRPIPCIPEKLHECKARDLVCSLLSLSSHSCGSRLLDAACLTVPVSFASA